MDDHERVAMFIVTARSTGRPDFPWYARVLTTPDLRRRQPSGLGEAIAQTDRDGVVQRLLAWLDQLDIDTQEAKAGP